MSEGMSRARTRRFEEAFIAERKAAGVPLTICLYQHALDNKSQKPLAYRIECPCLNCRHWRKVTPERVRVRLLAQLAKVVKP